VDAIGYTVEHDDGKGHLLHEAEIILLGVSRTCKTPISMYLACDYGYKVANIPIVLDDMLTDMLLRQLQKLDSPRIVGLLMQPEVLVQVREERSQLLTNGPRHHDDIESYCDRRYVVNEFRYSRDLFVRQGWLTIDVTRRAIEELSVEILEGLGLEEEDRDV
jgi:regulator of PEP synthase PpsR (kinase-PPPase family)